MTLAVTQLKLEDVADKTLVGKFCAITLNSNKQMNGFLDKYGTVLHPKVILSFPPAAMALFDTEVECQKAVSVFQAKVKADSEKPIEEREHLRKCFTCFALIKRINELKAELNGLR